MLKKIINWLFSTETKKDARREKLLEYAAFLKEGTKKRKGIYLDLTNWRNGNNERKNRSANS